MKITRILAPPGRPTHFTKVNYSWSGGKSVDVFDSDRSIRIETDTGLVGVGESDPARSRSISRPTRSGARTGIAEVAPALIGLDPRETST